MRYLYQWWSVPAWESSKTPRSVDSTGDSLLYGYGMTPYGVVFGRRSIDFLVKNPPSLVHIRITRIHVLGFCGMTYNPQLATRLTINHQTINPHGVAYTTSRAGRKSRSRVGQFEIWNIGCAITFAQFNIRGRLHDWIKNMPGLSMGRNTPSRCALINRLIDPGLLRSERCCLLAGGSAFCSVWAGLLISVHYDVLHLYTIQHRSKLKSGPAICEIVVMS